jgi:hypothetical protein
MGAVRALPDDIERVKRVVVVAFFAIGVHMHVPSQPCGKLIGPDAENGSGEFRMKVKVVAVEIAEHV